MAKKPKKPAAKKTVETLKHDTDKRKNIPTAEFQSVVRQDDQHPVRVAFERRNRDLDPQLVWRGKDEKDWSDLVIHVPPLYIQEKVHPKVLIDDLLKQTAQKEKEGKVIQFDLFADFNGIPQGVDKTDFYQHDQNWSNRMILGDSLHVMASLAEREGLRGKVQCIYLDPPYGIKYNSNFQWSTTSRDVKDGNMGHITREPEQVKAFRDTWRDGIHSYLTHLRDRLTVARDLLAESGSIFVQIGDENVHRVRALMEEIFGDGNFIAQIATKTSGESTGVYLSGVMDFVLWFAKNAEQTRYRPLFGSKGLGEDGADKYSRVRMANLETRSLTPAERVLDTVLPTSARVYRQDNITSQSVGRDKGEGAASWFPVNIEGQEIRPSIKVRWKTNEPGMQRLLFAARVEVTGNSLAYVRFLDDFGAATINNAWTDIGGVQSRSDPKVYVVQTPTTLIQRCILMATDPKALGVDIRGRSRTLRVNYRTSHQIRSQADKLLSAQVSDVDGNSEDRGDTVSVFNGPPPTIRELTNEKEEIKAVGTWISDHAKAGILPHEFGLFVRSDAQLDRARAVAKEAATPFKILDDRVETTTGYLSISTMHLAKGLEFRAVAVMACDDEIIPLQERIETVGDDTDLQEVYDTERHLLYVACTRARDHLLVTSVKPASEFLDDLRI